MLNQPFLLFILKAGGTLWNAILLKSQCIDWMIRDAIVEIGSQRSTRLIFLNPSFLQPEPLRFLLRYTKDGLKITALRQFQRTGTKGIGLIIVSKLKTNTELYSTPRESLFQVYVLYFPYISLTYWTDVIMLNQTGKIFLAEDNYWVKMTIYKHLRSLYYFRVQ